MLFITIWIVIAFFIVRGVTKSSKPDYVVEWDKKVKANERAIKIQSIAMPDDYHDSEEEWNAYCAKELAKFK